MAQVANHGTTDSSRRRFLTVAAGASNIIAFPGIAIANPTAQAPRIGDIEFPETVRQRASRQRNPYREPCERISYAVTVAGKLLRREAMHPDINHVAALRKGLEAARLLADKLERLIEQEG